MRLRGISSPRSHSKPVADGRSIPGVPTQDGTLPTKSNASTSHRKYELKLETFNPQVSLAVLL